MEYFKLSILSMALCFGSYIQATNSELCAASNTTQASECFMCDLECQDRNENCNQSTKKEETDNDGLPCYLCELEQIEQHDSDAKKAKKADCANKEKTTSKVSKASLNEPKETKKEEIIRPFNVETTGTLLLCLAAWALWEIKVNEALKNQKAIEGQPESFLVTHKTLISGLGTLVGGVFTKDPLVDQLKLIRTWMNLTLFRPAGTFLKGCVSAVIA